MPLPCSPVSNSTASESYSVSTSEDSDDSLITPRPGPADPAERTIANLSRPSVPVFATSPNSLRIAPFTSDSLVREGRSREQVIERAAPTASSSPSQASEPSRSVTFASKSAPQHFRSERASANISSGISPKKHAYQGGRRSPNSGKADRASTNRGYYDISSSSDSMNAQFSKPSRPPNNFIADSSADETTAIFQRHRAGPAASGEPSSNYGSVAELNAQNPEPDRSALAGESPRLSLITNADESFEGPASSHRNKHFSLLRNRSSTQRSSGVSTTRSDNQDTDTSALNPATGEHQSAAAPQGGWFKSFVDKYGSIELENKGSVARDHLALERTFLAWLRTSLSFASIGIAITQLFRLNISINDPSNPHATPMSFTPNARLRQVGKPLGATFIGISILILLLGFHRYFESQHYVIRGKFPASRGSVVIVSFVAGALIVASFVVVLAIAPTAFER